MAQCLFKLFWICCWIQLNVSSGEKATNQSSWSSLISDLFDHGYDVTEIPSVEDGVPLLVTVHQTLQAIREVSEKEQSITGSSTVTVVWIDNRLTWDPKKYSNLTVLTLPYSMVWTPSIDLTNTNFAISHIPPDPDETKLHITNDGQITMETSFRHSSGCPMNLAKFPFDSQTCTILITSHDIATTNVVLVPGVFRHRPEGQPPSWDIGSMVATTRQRLTQDGAHNVSDLLVKIRLNRLPNHYIYTIIIPVMLINALGIWSFFIPLKSGERVSTCIAVVLGVTVFQIVIIDVMPQSSRKGATPHVIIYLTMSFISLVGIMLCSVVTLNISYQRHQIKRAFWKILFFRVLAILVFKRREGLRKLPDRKVQSEKSANVDHDCAFPEAPVNDDSPDVVTNFDGDSEVTDMELLATIFDRLFFFTFVLVEIWMVSILITTFPR